MDGLTEGRMVHYVLENGEHRPAVIVKVWDKLSGVVNMQVFTDGINDESVNGHARNTMWKTSVPYSEEPKSSTWHWIEKA
jgi:hypothetical protein